MYKFARRGFLGVACLILSHGAEAAVSPLSLNIVPPAEFPPSGFTVAGARLSALWGRQNAMYGLDLGLVGNITDGPFGGIAVSGVFNVNHGLTTIIGLQAAGIANITTEHTHVIGLQIAGAVNSNSAESSVVGLQIAPLANLSDHTKICGFQVGLYNKAQEVYGFQIGLINSAQSLHGIQLGLVNFNQTGMFSVTPLINIGF